MRLWPKKAEPKKRIRPTMARSNMGFGAGQKSILQAGWGTTTTTPNQIAKSQLLTLQARCNQQFLSNPYGKRFVSLVKTAVVGPQGFQFIAMNKQGDELNERANEALETAWLDWGADPTLSGGMSWFDLQSLFIQTVAVEGEFLARIYRGSSYGKYAFQIQPIENWRLNPDLNRPYRNGNAIRLGIEYDSRDKAVAYWIRQDERTSTTEYLSGYNYSRIPADQILHCYMNEQVGQTRGWPWMATALDRMSMLDGFQEAAVVAARIGASKPFKLFTDTGDEYAGTDDSDPNVIIDAVTPGQVVELPNGYDLEAINTEYPSSHYASFVQTVLQGIASALGVSYNSLASDLEGVSYSTIRVAVLEDRDKWKSIQNWMTTCFLMPIYQEWLQVALLTGNVGNLNASMIDDLQMVAFQGRRWQWVDPLKDAQAAMLQVDLGTKSRSDIIREAGKDPQEVAKEIERENQFLKELVVDGIPQEQTEDD